MKPFFYVFAMLMMALVSCSKQAESEKPMDTEPNGDRIFVAPVGVQAYSFRHYFPSNVIATLDSIQDMGITEIEGTGGRLTPETFRKLCEERGISIPSTGAGFQELEEDPMAVVERAKALGANYVMCAWVPHKDGNFDLEAADRTINVFNEAGKVLADNGLTFCYHPHGYEFQPHESGTLMDYLMQNTNPEYVSYEMDVFWVQFGGGDPVELLKKYGDRWKLMHLKDMKKGIKKDLTGHTDVEYNVPLGTGELDMRNILIEARKIGIAHYFIEDESSSVLKQIPQSIAYLRSLTY